METPNPLYLIFALGNKRGKVGYILEDKTLSGIAPLNDSFIAISNYTGIIRIS